MVRLRREIYQIIHFYFLLLPSPYISVLEGSKPDQVDSIVEPPPARTITQDLRIHYIRRKQSRRPVISI